MPGSGMSTPCAACKLLRRRCAAGDCIFAPYFPPHEPQKFANVHKIYGASNVSKMLQVHSRQELVFVLSEVNEDASKHGRMFSHFRLVHASRSLPVHQRADAVNSLVYQADARVRDPVYGCVGAISALQQQLAHLQTELAVANAEMVCMSMHEAAAPNGNGNYGHCPQYQSSPGVESMEVGDHRWN